LKRFNQLKNTTVWNDRKDNVHVADTLWSAHIL